MKRYMKDIRPVAPRRKRTEAVDMPAAMIWGTVRWVWDSEMATAAIDFMGWTGMGMPKRKPVRML
uniref:Uncharacterized protein n=1 Tax=Nelumbo nucifera TaxID=4432 RepID=A0A822ZPH1_NELNU|nr:TPA_asm: hypothetical protein HUJ06_003046 [Nelumbo nucifera]